MSISSIQITDYSNEKSTTGVSSPTLTSANFDAQITLAEALVAAIDGLSIGQLSRATIAQVVEDDPGAPTDPFAQRELKWLVRYRGVSSGKIYTMEIAAPDLTDNLVPGTDTADLTSTDWVAFIAAFEAFARTPENTSALVEVIGATLVGRNN